MLFNGQVMKTANGVTIVQDLRVWDYNLDKGKIDLSNCKPDSGWWDGWFDVITDKGGRSLMNGERVTTVHPVSRERADY